MRFACCTVALLASMLASGQTLPTFDLPGSLELVDLPAEATPVEAMMVSLHPVWSKKLARLEMSCLRVLHRPRFRMGFSDPETVSALPVEHHIRQSIFMLLISA